MNEASKNTDIELFQEEEGNYYSPSAHMTDRRELGINVADDVIVASLEDWHKAMRQASLKMYMSEPVKDNRPLTYKTLKELGIHQNPHDIKCCEFWMRENSDGTYWLELEKVTTMPRFKTVGSVKLLIEALKGDE